MIGLCKNCKKNENADCKKLNAILKLAAKAEVLFQIFKCADCIESKITVKHS